MIALTWLSYVKIQMGTGQQLWGYCLSFCRMCPNSSDKELIGADKACVLTHALKKLFSQ